LACSGWALFRPFKRRDCADARRTSFTGINPDQSKALTEKAHIYLTTNGRIVRILLALPVGYVINEVTQSMAGLNSKNIRYFAENLDKAVRGEL
jgi:aspartate aminotransferase, cytoplasmic